MNSGDMMENKELLDDIRAGKSSTIKEVYKTYVSDVFGFTKSITGDDESAMTATKAAFLKFFKNVKEGHEPDDIRLDVMKLAYDEACSIAMPEKNSGEAKEDEDGPSEDEVTVIKRNISSTQVIDISSSPEESDRIIEEAEEDEFDDYYYDDEEDDYYYDDDDYDDDDDDDEGEKSRAGFVILLILNIILALVLLWLLCGLLRNINIVPENIDLGYSWFNAHVYKIF